MRISRRTMIAASAALPFASAARAATPVSIRIEPSRVLRTIPADFLGLGFESLSVAGLLWPQNQTYVRLVRNLGPAGMIRIGGNVSDYTTYEPNGRTATGHKATVLNDDSIRQFRGFLDATGWRVIWGVNLGTGTLENRVALARTVAQVMGDRLIALQVGNEPDLFVIAGHRKQPYGYNEWLSEYRQTKQAIRAALPNVAFAGPDVSDGGRPWLDAFARDEGRDIAMLTAHHYIAGQDNPASTVGLLLQEEMRFQQVLSRFDTAAKSARVPYRLSETATLYGGGKAGVSDSFASALWVLDYLFVLASHGAAGANLQTGINHLGRLSYYSPITDDGAGHYGAAPEYYGLLAFAQIGAGERLGVNVERGAVNLTAYAVRRGDGQVVLAVINKDLTRGATVTITGAPGARATAMRLTAPSAAALKDVTLGGVAVDGEGHWNGARTETVRFAQGRAVLDVPAASAALVSFTA
ncbi:MAG TPA: glycosyl hydrolase family 79 C-terminal domain-containing protein [Rhizomicrobium sp.]|nr:glycosyl hydrolase family 79 C-terminal domain-containing protein [Rhizomicrobium sp.]